MNLSAGFIRRPIATSLLMISIVVLGVIGYLQLPVAALPSVDFPTIQVTAQLPGADPQTTASSVATPLERQFGEIPGISQMTSSSGSGFTQVTLQFDRSRTVDSAAQDVQAAINAAAGQLPASLLTPPIYRKTNPADTPILLIALSSDTLPITKVSDYANSVLAQKISQVQGVGIVGIGGLQNPSIRVQVNPAQLAAENLDLEDVRAALTNATVNQPKGQLYGTQQAYELQTNDQLETAAGYEDLILAYRNGAPIRVRDVGRAVNAPEDRTLAGRAARGATPARRQCHGDRRRHQAVAAAAPGFDPAQRQVGDRFRPDADDPCERVGRAVHIDADDRPGCRRHRDLPAQVLGDRHSRDLGADLAGGNLRGHLRARLHLGQSFAHGADDRRRLRRGRRNRHDREHRPPYRGRRHPAARRARWRARDRVHHPLHLDFADRRVHSAFHDERRCRSAVPRIRRHRGGVHPGLGSGLPHAHADDVRKAAEGDA
jgi:hypothetical protein